MHKSKFEDTYFQGNSSIRVGDKLLDLTRPVVMGILNVTPDSFYSKSRHQISSDLVRSAEVMLNDGATIIDLGGYSTRPGAEDISVQEEIDRVLPAIEAIQNELGDVIISIDTFRSKVAELSLQQGAQIINDVSGFAIDPDMLETLKTHHPTYILMHMRGTPKTMTKLTDYDNIVKDVSYYFSEKINVLKEAGLTDIILDPGFGFSKTSDQSHELLAKMEFLNVFDLPILAGLSRKSMIYKRLGKTPEDALEGTIALNAIALSKGAKILRVHDVKPASELIRLLFGSDKQI